MGGGAWTAFDITGLIVEQYAEKYYDLETGKFYYQVMSVYVTPTGGYGTIATRYEL